MMPSLFIHHGGGPAFFMQGPFAEMFADLGQFLRSIPSLLPQTPKAILVVTAHWQAPVATLATAENPELIFDYYGFPAETYQLKYPAHGAPKLAQQAAALLKRAGIAHALAPNHGWDHGVFIPLLMLYPQAQIPVLALSLQQGLDPELHTAIGSALSPLRAEDVLIIGSGASYHNLSGPSNRVQASTGFDVWLTQALDGNRAHRQAHLCRWQQAPYARDSHPTAEHLLPLMVASAAGSDAAAQKLWAGRILDTACSAWAFGD